MEDIQTKQDGDLMQLVTFSIGEEEFGVDILKVQEIIRTMEITKVPRAPEFVEGVINLRGKVIPIIDLRKRFGLEARDHDKHTRIIVIELSNMIVGFVVDSVSEVLRIPADTVEPPPPVVSGLESEYISGVGKLADRLLIMLDLNRLLSGEEKEALSQVQPPARNETSGRLRIGGGLFASGPGGPLLDKPGDFAYPLNPSANPVIPSTACVVRSVRFPKELDPFFKGQGTSLRIFKSGPGTRAALAHRLLCKGRDVVFVVPGVKEYRQARALLALFGPQAAPEAPSWKSPWAFLGPYPAGRPDAGEWSRRWAALFSLTQPGGRGMGRGLLATADNFLPKWPPSRVLSGASLDLATGDELSPDMLLEQAVSWGYRRTSLVASRGDMALRGDILDIYAPGYSWPLRLEFFGDTLEEIRLFDPSTQRSRADLKAATILPAAPGVMAGEEVDGAAGLWASLRKTADIGEKEKHALEKLREESDGRIWPGLFYSDACSLQSWIRPDAVYVFASSDELRPAMEEASWSWKETFEREERDLGMRWPRALIHRQESAVRGDWGGKPQLVFENLVMGRERGGIELPETSYTSFEDLFWKPENRKRPWSALMSGLAEWKRTKRQTILSFRSSRAREKFLKLAENEDLTISREYSQDARGLFALVSPLQKGMDLHWADTIILGEEVVQPDTGSVARVRPDKAFQGLSAHDDLLQDELLVHRDYGLARFGGLHHLKMGDAANDYLLLFFDGDDKLYLPVDRIGLIQRYKGPEGTEPALDKLGGTHWAKTRDKARKAIEKIARELVEMYAYRKVAKGYAYGPVDEMYLEFETTFGFEETPDQAKAIRDVFEDMEKNEPMDRLVCGDVGFGKTEVALRAAFRAVLDGKQVALLCPTTILAEQHYQTFVSRMENFSVSIGMLSRFVPAVRQKKVLKAASEGTVDILIGTHRLLSKDVDLPRLGLLILDEEQRFGVKHKERLKALRKDVDVLTLTATPIPRTLQLSLSGIRSLSVIETPPPDRKAVSSAVIERDEGMLAGVLKRELERQGQVFWVHNRVRGLERVTEFVQKLAPDARVGMAHGQMSEKLLEETMHAFWHGDLDILVCTAIIESGMDFPRANTLVVDQAHMFGLGQLYQLRGRVGRSDRQAYAYFMVPSVENMGEVARRRMRIIMDLDYLGAGFRVAMEDLRLRGAGNILGEVQSGQIAKVGLDLFLEMLEEEVQRIKGGETRTRREPEINFSFEAHIPDEYIPDARERLRYYKALGGAEGERELEELELELKDRFGPIPRRVENFLGVLAFKKTLTLVGAARADLHPGRALISWDGKSADISPERILSWLESRSDRARLVPPASLEIRFDRERPIRETLSKVGGELELLSRDREAETNHGRTT